MCGLIKGTVKLESNYKLFVKEYEEEVKLLGKIFCDEGIIFEHIGSTSVEGLKAKPIIDIAIGVNEFKEFKYYENLFKDNDEYEVRNCLDNDEILIVKGNKEYTSVLIHLMELSSDRYIESILFGNYLRKNKNVLNAYQKLKSELALKYYDNRVLYTSSKSDFIKKVIDDAKKEM